MKNLVLAIRRNSWPIGIVLVVLSFCTIDAALIYTAFHDKATAPEENYYEKAVQFDKLKASTVRTTDSGWKAEVQVASAPLPGMPRRVDLLVHDREGKPVSGLRGTLTAVRPADARLSNSGDLIEVPGEEGTYRLLLKVPAQGLWEFQVNARRGSDDYRMIVRQDVAL